MDTEKLVVTLHDINYIPAYKEAEEIRQANENERQTAESIRELNEMTRETNEANRINNENERKTYHEELKQRVENGDLHGKNSVYVGEEEPKEEYWEVWIDPSGMPEVEASHLVFADKETLQDKYDNGELKGEKGDTPDLRNYATKEYVENEIATFDFIKVVDVLPEQGLENRFYFVPKSDTQTQDLFDEYVWINGVWEWVTTKQIEVDLTPYYKKSEIDEMQSNIEKVVETQKVTNAGTNVNDYTKTGTYFFNYANSPTNSPYSGVAGWLKVIENDANDIKQIWYVYNSDNLRYERIKINGTWSSWQLCAVVEESWKSLILSNSFKAYNDVSSNAPVYKKTGNIVGLRGCISPTNTLEGAATEVLICTLPSGYRPSGINRNYLCQGGSLNKWMLTIKTTGEVFFSRYSTNEYNDCPNDAWLPFDITFMI